MSNIVFHYRIGDVIECKKKHQYLDFSLINNYFINFLKFAHFMGNTLYKNRLF